MTNFSALHWRFSAKSAVWSESFRPDPNCSSDHEVAV